MRSDLYPLLFAPIYQDYVWGGTRIRDAYGRSGAPSRCAESWEVADRPEGCSVVSNGPHAGESLHQLLETQPEALMGTGFGGRRFPLLVKVLDAREVLSVQVHPDDARAAQYGGEAKTEMWHLLAADAGAHVYAGLKPGVTTADFRRALSAGAVPPLLQRLPMHADDTIFIPGGQIHAVGPGCMILEIQQNSNTTYRLYDWDRLDAQGKPRALHLDEGLRVARWADAPPPLAIPSPRPAPSGATCSRLVACPYFTAEAWSLSAAMAFTGESTTCHLLFVKAGELHLSALGHEVTLRPGTTCLLPASCVADATLTPIGPTTHFICATPGP